MRRSFAAGLLAASTLLVMAFSGAALAGNGHGNDNSNGNGNAYGHADEAPPAQPAPPAEQQQQASDDHHGWSKHDDAPAPTQANDEGVKPSNETAKDTHERADSSKTKQYGNGQTAGRIATSRGASGDTILHGPGNSQPHKLTACGHRHEVDVHAIKSYGDDACKPVAALSGVEHKRHEESKPAAAPQAAATCAESVTVTVPAGVWHQAGSGWVHRGWKRHGGDELVVSRTTTRTILVADACKKSEGDVQALALQQAVPRCGHHLAALQPTVQAEQKPAAVVLPATPEVKKVYICHATGSATNPYVLIHVSKQALKAHTSHQGERDVVLGETPGGTCPAATPAAPAAAAPTSEQPAPASQTPAPAAQAAQPAPASETPAPAAPTETPAPATPAAGVAGATAALASPATPAAAPAQGGVLGVQATLPTRSKPRAGVLGTVASTTLPFTGIQLWLPALVAGLLVIAGAVLRRTARGSS